MCWRRASEVLLLLTNVPHKPERKQLLPFAALSASYFAHIGFFNPYLPLWLKELGFGSSPSVC
ncbi:hypothetical protein Y695_04021 [Hydrogenophaga sp. T4]|nr:hypothetical protein Y695_04021 [Hydrogenophaga sp. T4]